MPDERIVIFRSYDIADGVRAAAHLKQAGIAFELGLVNAGSSKFPRRVQVISVSAADEATARAAIADVPSECMTSPAPAPRASTLSRSIVAIQLGLLAFLLIWALVRLLAEGR